jgi:signal transduction histidine kinase/ActR/RegA family two-component response regulator
MLKTLDPRSERILLLPLPEPDASFIHTVLEQAGLAAQPCADIQSLCREIDHGAGTALLTEEALSPEVLQLLVKTLQRQEVWSDFPLVLFFHSGEESTESSLRMLRMLEPLGNITLLQRPVRTMNLVSALQSALRGRRRQYQIRDLLAQRDEAVQARDEFLTLLAHELRNPLSVIRNATEILNHISTPQSNVVEQQRAVIGRQTEQLARLIGDVLDMYRIKSGTIALNRQPVNLAELAGRSLQVAAGAAQAKRQALSFAPPTEGVLVDGDPERLEQIIVHLLTNAVQYTPPGGRVTLSVGREGDRAVLRVKDTGVGLDAEKLPRLFERFPDVRKLRERPEGGLRIGLSLVQGLVELHGGSVTVTSPGRGRGSEFIVRLPLRTTPVPEQSAPAGKPGSRRILLVEDNPDGRATLRLMLQLWGHQVDEAADGVKGLQKALATRPEIAVIDIGLPGLDGYQVARHIRTELGRGICLIAVTGYGQPHDRERSMEAGFDAHLVKPVDPDELHDLLVAPELVIHRRAEG